MIDGIGKSSSVRGETNAHVNHYYNRHFSNKPYRVTYHRKRQTYRGKSSKINTFPSVNDVGKWIRAAVAKITSG